MGGADLAALLTGAPFEHDTSLGGFNLAMEKEEDNDNNSKEGMECGQDLLQRRQGGLATMSWTRTNT
jgi:hypothetical protein